VGAVASAPAITTFARVWVWVALAVWVWAVVACGLARAAPRAVAEALDQRSAPSSIKTG
jgi:hypothetical protein